MPKSRGMLFGVFIALLLWGAMGGCARAQTYPVVRVEDYPEYANVRAQLQALVNAYGFHDKNQFCIIAYKYPDDSDDPSALTLWPEEDELFEWGDGPSPLLIATMPLDLTRDVIPDNVYNPSTYLLRKSFVVNLIKDCHARGEKYTITKTRAGWMPVSKFPQFASITKQLQYLADEDGSPKTSKFCVIGQQDGPFLAAYVYWQTQQQLIMWLPGQYDDVDPSAVADSFVNIDLKSDLSDDEVMQKSYALAILHACKTSGQRFIFQKLQGNE